MMEGEGRPSRGAVVVAILLLAGILWEVGASVAQHAATPRAADWQAATTMLRELRKAGEPILVAPRWSEAVAYSHLQGQIDLRDASLPDVDRFPRVWELSIRGARHPWLQALEPAETHAFGGVNLARYDREPARILYDFREQLAHARVLLVGEEARECRLAGERFICDPHHGWSWVGPQLAEVGFRPYQSIYAHPHPGQRLMITFPNVELGRAITVYTGIHDFISRRDSKAPVLFQVTIDGELVLSVSHRNNWPWKRFDIDTRQLAGSHHRVRFEVTSKETRARTFVFHAEARR